METLSSHPLLYKCLCTDGWITSFNDIGSLWRPAALALRELTAPTGTGVRWEARFEVSHQEGDPAATLLLTVSGSRSSLADFIQTGALRFETFTLIDTRNFSSNDELYTVRLLRNSRRTLADLIRIDPDPDADDESAQRPADREFQIDVEAGGDAVSMWRVAAQVKAEEPTESTESDVPLAAPSLKANAGSGLAGSSADGWGADDMIWVNTYSPGSGVNRSGFSVKAGKTWYEDGSERAGNTRAWISRINTSDANPVGYTVYGTNVHRL